MHAIHRNQKYVIFLKKFKYKSRTYIYSGVIKGVKGL